MTPESFCFSTEVRTSFALLRLNLHGKSVPDQAGDSAVLSGASLICTPLSPGRLELIVSSLNCHVCSWHSIYRFASDNFERFLVSNVECLAGMCWSNIDLT